MSGKTTNDEFFTLEEIERFADGSHCRLHEKLGAHPTGQGTRFSVWAPNARAVSVVGDFNGWDAGRDALAPLGESGVWSGQVAGVEPGALYKYRLESRDGGYVVNKADPFAFRAEQPPKTASVVWSLDHAWNDAEWMEGRARHSAPDAPMAIYELHLGSWKRDPDDPGRLPGYREIADELVPYLQKMNFTHVELLPPKEHPFYGSWGYQTTGYFAATSRYGSPQELMQLIDEMHRAGIGVILDWVPSHFPDDEHGLRFFDGTHLYEHADPRQGHHPDWKSSIFNYGRGPVRSFLLSSALFWLERYHVDALRVDAVASMLYLDYSREPDEWIPNKYGGRENIDAITFLRKLNDTIHARFPDVKTIAEESTSWPMVSRPPEVGGLGFDMKWDLGWMHDTLEYMGRDPVHRRFHQRELTFRGLYAFTENFVLPLSHDEVVHGKGSLIGKMSGDRWQKFASLRALYGYMYGQPGKKLLFMGAELGQWSEWDHERGLEWELAQYPEHAGLQRWVEELNKLYRDEPALHKLDFSAHGFRWIDCDDHERSVLAFTRHACAPDEDEAPVLVVCNFTPVVRYDYRLGVPHAGSWRELLNSDSETYGGSGVGNLGEVRSVPMRYHGHDQSVLVTLPPLATVYFKYGGQTSSLSPLLGDRP